MILTDPDFNDWSPWLVIAKNKRVAIAQARRDWCDEPGSAEVVKVYHRVGLGASRENAGPEKTGIEASTGYRMSR